MKISANEIKIGNILEIDNKLWKVLKLEHTKPGKGGAYVQAELKEISDGTKKNERFRSDENIEKAYLEQKKFQFLYSKLYQSFLSPIHGAMDPMYSNDPVPPHGLLLHYIEQIHPFHF